MHLSALARRNAGRVTQQVFRQCGRDTYRAAFATVARADYDKFYRASLNDREAFWGEVAQGIDWVEPYKQVLDESRKPFYRWFTGGKLNVCYNCVDRHLPARADQPAIIYDSPLTSKIQRITYRELHESVSRMAGVLSGLDVTVGDRVVIYMPMIPEAAIAMLACCRIGAVHSVVFGGFGASELAIRIDDAEPEVVLTATCGIEPGKVIEYMPLLNKAIELAKHKVSHVVVKQREQCRTTLMEGRDHDWDEATEKSAAADCVPVDSNHPLYILYTSGTTGKPKGIVRDSAPHAAALKWSMSNFMMTNPGETYWAASDVGWVVGHSYIVYGPLLQGCSTIMFEGKPVGTPDAGTFWRVISDHQVRGFFTAPTALRAIRKDDPKLELLKNYDVSCLRKFFVAGERCDPATADAFSESFGAPIVDNWWQTETGWPICGFQDDAVGMKPGSASLPFPGYDVHILDAAGRSLPPNTPGDIAIKLPLPPSCFPTLWQNDERYIESYMSEHPGFYTSGDAGTIDEDGYITVLERTDDVINVAAHRLSTGRIEAVVKAQRGVSDAAVVGAPCDLKGQTPIVLVVLNAEGAADEAGVFDEIRRAVREEVGAIASLGAVAQVEQLPKTRSGKVLRKNIRGLASGRPYAVPGTIENPQAMDIVQQALKTIGYP